MMDRRECVGAVSAALAVTSVPANVEVIEAEPPPLLLVVTSERPLSCQQREEIRQALAGAFGGREHPPIVVCDQGTRVEAVRLRKVELTDEDRAEIRKAFEEMVRSGSLGRVQILPTGMDVAIGADASAFEVKQADADKVAREYGIPLHRIEDVQPDAER